MTIDKFGRSLKTKPQSLKGLKGEGFNLTEDGNYDLQTKRLCNVAPPLQPLDAVTKGYVDGKSIPSNKERYDFRKKRLYQIGDPKDPLDAVNLRSLNKLSLILTKDNYDAQNKQISNVALPIDINDAATKDYVDQTFSKSITPLSTNIAKIITDIGSINSKVAKCEGLIVSNKEYHDKQLKKFGTYIFNYINQKQTGRSATLPQAGPDDYLNWEELFKLPKPLRGNDKEEEEEVMIPDDDEPGLLVDRPVL